MRDDSILERESVAAEARTEWRGRTATAAGALISLVVLTLIITWSYRLGVRDAADIPVIRAELEATKIKPEEPGGMIVDHQDRVVYDVVGGQRAAEEVTLAAPAEGLAAEDLAPSASPGPAPRPIPAPDAEVVIASPEPAPETAEPIAEVPEFVPETPVTEPVELTEATPEAPAPPEPVAAPTAETETEPEPTADEVAEAAELTQAPKFAPSAPPRPARATRTAAPNAPKAEADAPEPRAAALASAIQIQLGAFVSEAIAAEQWTKIKSRNGDLLTGRGRVITTVLSGGRRLYRLRAGPFENVAQASALCRALQGRDQACIVARAR